MPKPNAHFLHARSLQADVLGAPDDFWLPRREILLEWLTSFVQRAEKPNYDLGETEAADLTAIEQYLRKKKVPVAPSV